METQELIKQIGLLSYGGVWLLSFAANVIVPVPEEAILLILGFLAAGPQWNGYILVPVIFAGVIASDIIIYILARKGNKIIMWAYNKIFASKVEGKTQWINKHMDKVIFFSRFLIQLRFLGPFLAGHMKVPFRKFITLDVAALLIYIPAYLTIGWYFRSRIEFILSGVGVVRNIVMTLVIIMLMLFLMKILRSKFYKIKSEETNE